MQTSALRHIHVCCNQLAAIPMLLWYNYDPVCACCRGCQLHGGLKQRGAVAQAVAVSVVGGGLCEVTRRHASKREGAHEERNQKSVEANSTRRHGSSQTQVVENFDTFFGFDVFLHRERRQRGKKLQGP